MPSASPSAPLLDAMPSVSASEAAAAVELLHWLIDVLWTAHGPRILDHWTQLDLQPQPPDEPSLHDSLGVSDDDIPF